MSRNTFFLRLALLLLCLVPVAQADWYKRSTAAMGTEVSVQLWADDSALAERAIHAVFDEMARIDQAFSPYIESSELSVLNRQAGQADVPVSVELFELLLAARRGSEFSGGAFDISFAAAGHSYDFRQAKRPDAAQLASVLPAIDYRKIRLNEDSRSVRFLHKAMRVDLGGIAKGHAVDKCIHLLQAMGIRHAMVAAGGDSRLLGDKRGQPWVTGIKDPRGEQSLILLPLDNVAISTSGDYERYFLDPKTNTRYHHILLPGSGDSARELRSATVIGPDARSTDVLSTSLFVLGVERGLELINAQPGFDAVLIDSKGLLHYSAQLQQASEN